MKLPVRITIEEESKSLRREGRILSMLLWLVLAVSAAGVLAVQMRWFE